MHVLVPLIAALLPLVIAPGLVSYFDITPKIAILLFGTTLILLYPAANVRNVRALMTGPLGRWFVVLLAAQWLAEGEKVYSKFADLKSAEGRKLDLDRAKEAIDANKKLLGARAKAATTQKSS